MRPDEHARMFAFEDHYWWFVGRQAVLRELLDQHLPPAVSRRILDVGCGSGATMKMLLRYGVTYGLDPFPSAIRLSRSRGLERLLLGDAARLPFESESFDLVTALDVFEHIADDQAAIGEAKRVLAPGGRLLLTVPAYGFLWSQHDEALDHYRRYLAAEVGAKVAGTGLVIDRLTYCITFLLPAAVLMRLGERVLKRGGEPKTALIELPRPLNRLCLATVELEAKLLRHFDLPCGVSVVCLAHRPGGD